MLVVIFEKSERDIFVVIIAEGFGKYLGMLVYDLDLRETFLGVRICGGVLRWLLLKVKKKKVGRKNRILRVIFFKVYLIFGYL